MQIIITIYEVWKQIMMYVFYVCTSSVRNLQFLCITTNQAIKSIPRKFSQIGGLNYDPHIRLLLVQE